MLSQYLLYIVTISLALASFSPLCQPHTIPLDAQHNNIVGSAVFYFEDKSLAHTAKEVITQLDQWDWQAAKDESVTIGNVASSYWLTSRIITDNTHHDWIITIKHPGLNDLNVWVFDGNTLLKSAHMGADLPFSQRPFNSTSFRIPVNLEANHDYRLLFRVSMVGVLDFPVSIATAEKTAELISDEQMKIGIYYGIAIVMILYNFMIFIYSREISYLLYVLFVGSLTLFLASVDGLGFQYLWSNYPSFNRLSLPLTTALTQLFALLFTESFLTIRHQSRGLFSLLIVVMFMNIFAIITALTLETDIALLISSCTAIFTYLIIFISGIYMWLQGQIYARYFTIAWAALCFFCLWLTAAALGLVPLGVHNIWGLLRIASAVEMILLALALATRIDVLSRNEEKALTESQAKSQFIAQISHELRTPMNGILGMSALLRDHLEDKQAIHYNSVIYQSGLALLGTINDVLDTAKIDADKLEIEMQPFNLKSLCEQSLYVIEPQSMVKSLIITSDIDGLIPHSLLGDPNRIRQILLNFLSNAAKFTEQGTINLRAKVIRENYVRISVSDSGCGIPLEEQDKLFKPYSQHNSNPLKSSGTGLGLYICYHLTKMMRGKIGVDSVKGKGATFWIELPLEASSETPKPLLGQLDDTIVIDENMQSLHILVAEDNLTNQLVIKKLLKEMGHTTTIVGNGEEAVSAVIDKKSSFDLILMDYEMPVMNGCKACKKIRAHEQVTHSTSIPIIALTAHALMEYKGQCLDAGMNDVLTKPVLAPNLQQILLRFGHQTE